MEMSAASVIGKNHAVFIDDIFFQNLYIIFLVTLTMFVPEQEIKETFIQNYVFYKHHFAPTCPNFIVEIFSMEAL